MPGTMNDGYMLRKRTSPSDGLNPDNAVLPKWPLNLWVDYDNLNWKSEESARKREWEIYWSQI